MKSCKVYFVLIFDCKTVKNLGVWILKSCTDIFCFHTCFSCKKVLNNSLLLHGIATPSPSHTFTGCWLYYSYLQLQVPPLHVKAAKKVLKHDDLFGCAAPALLDDDYWVLICFFWNPIFSAESREGKIILVQMIDIYVSDWSHFSWVSLS